MNKRPSAQILVVGTELLLGNVLDTNSHTLSIGLAELGINLYYRKTVGDNFDRLVFSIHEAMKESDILILSGGMGSTVDDITVEAVCKATGTVSEYHTPTLEKIKNYYRLRGTIMSENNKKQALLPKGAEILENTQGMAPGVILEKNGKTVIILPGPPRELTPLFREKVMPFLRKKYGSATIASQTLRFWGIAESAMDEKVSDLTSLPSPTVAPYAKNGETLLRVSSSGKTREECFEKILPVAKEIKSRLAEYFWTDKYDTLEQALCEELKERNLTIAAAESCTGGLVAKRLTDIPGASSIFGMSAVTYSAEAKKRLAGVSEETIAKFGTVSAECAEEMANGIRAFSGASIGVSVTGVAGPSEDEGKPVGLMFIGISTQKRTFSKRYFFPYPDDRMHIRLLASSACLAETLFTLRNGE